jgi:hypothetical protein
MAMVMGPMPLFSAPFLNEARRVFLRRLHQRLPRSAVGQRIIRSNDGTRGRCAGKLHQLLSRRQLLVFGTQPFQFEAEGASRSRCELAKLPCRAGTQQTAHRSAGMRQDSMYNPREQPAQRVDDGWPQRPANCTRRALQ